MAGAKKNFKATKKFETKHLKSVLDQRKLSSKIKQREHVKDKKLSKRSKDEEFLKGPADSEEAQRLKAKSKTANVGEMSVDDFFGGGFEIIDTAQPGKKASKKLGKRKRDQPAGEDEDGASDLPSEDEQQEASDSGESDGEDDAADVGMSKEAMDALAKDDPEFYKFLQENDPEALEFDDADLAEVDDLSAGEEEQPKKKRKQDKKVVTKEDSAFEADDGNELTQDMVAKWKASLTENYSLRAARQVVLAFRSAAHLNETDEDGKTPQRYTISSPEAFHDILIVALKQIPEVLKHHVPVKETAHGRVQVPTNSKKFRILALLLKSFASAILHLLGTLSDDATLKLTLSALEPLVPYLLSFRKLLKTLIKTVVDFWSQSTSSESTRITAFLVLRRLVVVGDKGIREAVLKATYQGLLAGSRLTNANTLQGINLMKNSAAELWGIDQGVGYTTAFSFIRQLAIHLRNSIVHNKNDSYRNVYNWQYVHSLDFWSYVLAEHCNSLRESELGKESQLKLLIYPLVQVTLGAMRLIPTAIYFPLRFHMTRSLLRLSRSTGTYIPLAPALLEVLNSAEMRKSPKASTIKPLEFHVNYKASKAYLRTRIYQDGVVDQLVELFSEYFVLWSTNIAFPEFALPVIIMLKRWLKQSRKKAGNNNNKLRTGLVLLVQKLETNSKFIEGQRAKVDFAPKDRAQVDSFLKDFGWEKTPIGAYVVAQRKSGAEKMKMLEEARKEDDKKRKEEQQEALEANGMGEDDDDEAADMLEEAQDEEEDDWSEDDDE